MNRLVVPTLCRMSRAILVGLATLLHPLVSHAQSMTPAPTGTHIEAPSLQATPTISTTSPFQAVSQLNIDASEALFRVNPTLSSLSDLVYALEQYLAASCFGALYTTLQYAGPPSDPECIRRMNQLLELYPNNPVAVCVQDGIESKSCQDASREQVFEKFVANAYPDASFTTRFASALDSTAMRTAKSLADGISDAESRYQRTTETAEQRKLFDESIQLYEQLLGLTCAVSALMLQEPEGTAPEDPAIKVIREKLLSIPVHLRADYQAQFMEAAEQELAQAQGDPARVSAVRQKMKVIQNPDNTSPLSAKGKIRIRIVLPECYSAVGYALRNYPSYASPVCYRDGWHTPQCIQAVKRWYLHRKKMASSPKDKEPQVPGTSPRATPQSLITTF